MPEIDQTISHYRILQKIGAGGMGEVYLADDTTLDRKVALKFLPEAFTTDPERMARFEREAKLLASLNHPNIAGIHGLEKGDGNRFLVLEYVEGETLQARLSKGALPLEDALAICRQIAEGLEAAHEKGVIHRDLKPANVMITVEEKVKILDFGLAKAFSDDTQRIDSSQSPTLTEAMTRLGVILGTAAYMSPEQAKGKSVDKRADIWAFGCILYECLTGKKAFEGETVTETLAAVIRGEPELDKIPAKVQSLLLNCLEKDPKKRLRDIGDAAVLIEIGHESPSGAATVGHRWFTRVWAFLIVMLVIALVILSLFHFRGRQTADASFFHLSVPPMPSNYGFALSPDGKWIAFAASTPESAASLFVCKIGSVTPTQISGTEGAKLPFWSPDSESIAFYAGGWLKRLDISDKSLRNICPVAVNVIGGSWSKDGTIIFCELTRVRRVSSEGGEPSTIINPDESQNVLFYHSPFFLPDGRNFLFSTRLIGESEKGGVYLASLDSEIKIRLFDAISMVAYIEPGYLIFQRDRTLYAQPFNLKKREFTGKEVSIAHNLLQGDMGISYFSIAKNVLVYRTGKTQAPSQFLWFDRTGAKLGLAGTPGNYGTDFDLSPDGKKIAVTQYGANAASGNIWLLDWERDIAEPFTFEPMNGVGPVWSYDGNRISYVSMRNGNVDIFERPVSGPGEEKTLVDSADSEWLDDWSKDGRYIAYTLVEESRAESADIYVLPLFGDRKPWPIVQRPLSQDEPHFSYDGRWLAYDSNESGIWQVYIVSFPEGGYRRQISTEGGGQPRWRQDGKKLYYLAMDGKMMAVDISGNAELETGRPQVLFDTGLVVDPTNDQYDVTADGERFLVLKPLPEAESSPITVVLNWVSLLEK